MSPRDTPAWRYAAWCLEEGDGAVGSYVKKQAAAWLAIARGGSAEAYVCEKSLRAVYALLALMSHPDLGRPLSESIEGYAHLLIAATLCTKSREGDPPRRRHYHTAVLEIGRKNFKTFNSAIIIILLMLTSPPGSRFFSVAPDMALASEVMLAVRKIIRASPALSRGGSFEALRSEVRCRATDSSYMPLAYSNHSMDGRQASAFVADEAGAMDPYPMEAMRSSQLALRNRLGIVISTRYPNDCNGMLDEIDKSKKVLDGLLDDRRFSLLYEPDEALLKGDAWQTDDRIIMQANPAAASNPEILRSLLARREDAVLYENKRENFLCKHCNIHFRGLGAEGFVEIDRVRACRAEPDPAFWRGRRAFIGLDLSLTEDNTAVAVVARDGELIRAKAWGFVPAAKIREKSARENLDYARLIARGDCFACGDEVIGYPFVEAHIMGLPESMGIEIAMLGYDRMNAISTVQKLEAAGIECAEIKQHSSVLHPATKLLKESVLSGALRYEANLLLENNFANARCSEDSNLNKYVHKKRSAGKVDMVAALVNALHLLQQDELHGAPAPFEFAIIG